MAASKKKQPKSAFNPKTREIGQRENPEKYYQLFPSWNFNSCDDKLWQFNQDRAESLFWNEILPRLKAFETQKWEEILVIGKKQNHSIYVKELHTEAKKRLEEMFIEQDSIISLRLTGTHRLYGFISKGVFNIVWFDDDHGDNSTCVCRSYKKHT